MSKASHNLRVILLLPAALLIFAVVLVLYALAPSEKKQVKKTVEASA